MLTFRRILYPTDFSPASDQALPYAADLARAFGATLHLLHVVQDQGGQPWVAEAYGYDLHGIIEGWVREANDRLRRLSERTGLPCVVACRRGRPETEILDYVRDTGIDLVVMGSHGYGKLAHFLLGSVAERIVRHAPCPVLTVKQLTQAQVARDVAVAMAAPEKPRAPAEA